MSLVQNENYRKIFNQSSENWRWFEVEEGFYEWDLSLFVGVHDLSKMNEETRKKILVMPSLLGREILNEFDLYYFPRSEKVYLERE